MKYEDVRRALEDFPRRQAKAWAKRATNFLAEPNVARDQHSRRRAARATPVWYLYDDGEFASVSVAAHEAPRPRSQT